MNIDYACFVNKCGYAQAARGYIESIKLLNYDIKLSLFHPEPEQLSISPDKYLEYLSLIRKPRKNDAIQILHCVPEMQKRMPKGNKTVGFATFETFNPPQEWIGILNSNDAVICPSEFNVKIFREAGVKKPIFHIPHAFDKNLINPNIVPMDLSDIELLPPYKEHNLNDGRFTFMFVGSWRNRKGYQQLLEAWMREFDKTDNVKLLIKTDRYTMCDIAIKNTQINLGLEKKEIAPIFPIGSVFDEIKLPAFFKAANCFISPTLGEGFGLPGLEFMALGVPVIITNFSGVTDYAKDYTANLIEPSGFIVYSDLDAISQFKNRKWAHVTVESIRQSMRNMINNYNLALDKAKVGSDYVSANFSYETISEKIKNLCNNL